ncbi:MAG: YHS domain protein [Rhodospirillales bacterium]|nr:YHS domain protein [Rhodospirillales bacterium]
MKKARTAQSDLNHVIRSLILMTAASLVLLAMIATAGAGQTVYTSGGAAIQGYDPVAYFTAGKPTRGSADHSAQWMGVTWRFASADNKARFEADPAAFAPQYGGYCAWAVSQGYTAKIDPAAWRIEDDKLYLNYSKSVQRNWAKNIPGNIAKGDANWPGIKAELAAK